MYFSELNLKSTDVELSIGVLLSKVYFTFFMIDLPQNVHAKIKTSQLSIFNLSAYLQLKCGPYKMSIQAGSVKKETKAGFLLVRIEVCGFCFYFIKFRKCKYGD